MAFVENDRQINAADEFSAMDGATISITPNTAYTNFQNPDPTRLASQFVTLPKIQNGFVSVLRFDNTKDITLAAKVEPYRAFGNTYLNDDVTDYREVVAQNLDLKHEENQRAVNKNNHGFAMLIRGANNSDTKFLEQAAAAIRSILRVWGEHTAPKKWAMSQYNLGNAVQILGACTGDRGQLDQAAEAYHAALRVWGKDSEPMNWAAATENLVLLDLAFCTLSPDPARLIDARVKAFAAREAYRRARAAWNIKKIDQLLAEIHRLTNP